MSDCELENSLDMDYDLWEGQFEFVGPSSENGPVVPQGLLKVVNGVKKSAEDQVRFFFKFFFLSRDKSSGSRLRYLGNPGVVCSIVIRIESGYNTYLLVRF